MGLNSETTINVTGMSCGACVRHVEAALRKLAGVASVAVDLEKATAVIQHEPGRPTLDELLGAVRAEGYDGAPVG
jgi:copper chaperone